MFASLLVTLALVAPSVHGVALDPAIAHLKPVITCAVAIDSRGNASMKNCKLSYVGLPGWNRVTMSAAGSRIKANIR